jgi:cell division protein FtsW
MVTSASIYIAQNLTGNPFYFATRQALFIGIGIFSFTLFLLIPSKILERTDWLFLLITIFLLGLLFIPGIGTEVNGSIRWIRLGPINIQPAEICKFSMILYTSGYCVRRMNEISTLRGFLKPLLLLGLVSFLILSQPDLGTTAIICAVVVAILFFAGISVFQFLLLLILLGILGFIAIYFTPFRLTRVMSFMDPFESQLGAGWQLSNSLIGIGQANWIGLGLGNSFQKNLFLPEAHTDFIFAILVEELGIFGVIFLLCMYILMIYSIFSIAMQSLTLKRFFQGFVAFGIGFLISIQTIFNLSVNLGLIPTKGLTLPFISYGGTSIIIMMSFIAIVLRINNENKYY